MKISVVRSKVQGGRLMVFAARGSRIPMCEIDNRVHYGSEFSTFKHVNALKSIEDYPRLKRDINEAVREVKAQVNRRFLKKYPINCC